MPRINLKLLVWLMGGAVVLSGVVYGIHAYQYQRLAGALLWQARHAEEQGQTERMVRYLQRYLEFAPRDLEEKARLAQAQAKGYPGAGPRSRLNALYLLDSILVSDPSRTELRQLLVKTALETGKSKMARDHLTYLWKRVLEAPDKVPLTERGLLEGYWGQLALAENQPTEALTWFQHSIDHNPTEQANYIQRAYLLRQLPENDPNQRKNNYDEADRLLNVLVERNRDSSEAYLARWNYRRRFDLVTVDNSAGKRAVVRDTSEDAGADITQALKYAPEAPEALLAAADLEKMFRQRETARKHLERAIELQAKPGATVVSDQVRYQLLWHLCNLLLDTMMDEKLTPEQRTKDGQEAEFRISQLRRFKTYGASADFLDGRLHMNQHRWAEAIVLFERARPLLAGQPEMGSLVSQIDIYLGQCSEQVEEPGQMLTAFERASKYDPRSAVALLGMGSALWLQGRLDEAMEKYREAMKSNGVTLTGWIDITRLEMQRQLQRDPANRDWTEAKGALDQAEKSLEERRREQPGLLNRVHELTLLRADLLSAQEQFPDAEKVLREALKAKANQAPKIQAELWAGLSRVALRAKDRPRALALLDEADRALGFQIELRLARVRYWACDPSKQAAGRLQELEPETAPADLSVADQARLLDELAEANFRIGNPQRARLLCKKLAQHPNHQSDLRLRLLLFDLALQAHDEADMDRLLGEIRAIERVGGGFSRYGQALRLIAQVREGKKDQEVALKEARLLLQRVNEARPNWPAVCLARASIHELEGNTAGVIEELKNAIKRGDNNPAIIRRLVIALNDSQRSAEADEEMKKLRASLLVNSELGRLAAATTLRNGDPARALDLARGAVGADSKDFRDHLLFAQILLSQKNREEARKELELAKSLAPTEPAPYVGLVQFLMAGPDKGHAEAAAIQNQIAGHVDPSRRTLAEAQCYEARGEWKDARAAYDKALREQPDHSGIRRAAVGFYLRTGRLDDAEKLLRTIATTRVANQSRQQSTSETDRLWARHSLAMLLADGTDYTRFQEALELVGIKLEANGIPARDAREESENPDTLRARARVLATQDLKPFRQRARELFELLARSQSLTDEDRFILALLHENSGEWLKARDLLEQLALKENPLAQHLVYLARGLIREKEYDQAEVWIKKLEELEKKREIRAGTFGTVELRARLLEGRGRGTEARDLLREHANRKNGRPEDLLLLAISLNRQKRYQESFEVLDEIWKKCPPELAGGASVSLLRQMKPSDEQVVKVEEWLKKAIDKEPSKMVLRMHLADLQDLRARYDQAEETLRLILRPENQPNNVVALNNLAWILAQKSDEAEKSQALTYINTAVKGVGRRAELLDTRGVVYLALGRAEEAVADLQEANAEAPSATRLFHLARAHFKAGDKTNAAKVLRQAQLAGLEPEALHPSEQKACKELLAKLNIK